VDNLASNRVGDYGRKVLIFHMPAYFNYKPSTQPKWHNSVEELFARVVKGLSMDGRESQEFLKMRTDIETKIGLMVRHLGSDMVGFTIVVDRASGEWAWSVCRKPDQFSRPYGRLLALNRLAEKVGGEKRARRMFRFGVLYLVPVGAESPDALLCAGGIYPDIREELSWIGGN